MSNFVAIATKLDMLFQNAADRLSPLGVGTTVGRVVNSFFSTTGDDFV